MKDPLAVLQDQYRASFADKAAAIEAALAAAAADVDAEHWGITSLETLASLVHKLAGSSGAYGYDDIYEQALLVDRQIKVIDPTQDCLAADAAMLQKAVNKLVTVLRAYPL